MALVNKIQAINDNLDSSEDKLQRLYDAHKDEWPDNALEGGVFQLMKSQVKTDKKWLTKVVK
ncbi:hypothetical protein N9Z41_02340 [bacterium]|nr:hypothetical protein [bacterium]